MNIGIITFQESTNYGALLQAFALKSTLEDMGYKADIINYHCLAKEEHYSKNLSSKKSLANNLSLLFSVPLTKKIKKECDDFRLQNLKLTERAFLDSDISELNNQYDAFICGSDQVWNPTSIKHDGVFFLKFVKGKRKISYAPSVGVNVIEEKDREFFIDGINNIDHLSVREQSAAEMIQELTGRNAEVVLDPTIIADKKIWEPLSAGKSQGKKYIFVYMVGFSKIALGLARKLSKINALDILTPAKNIKAYTYGVKCFAGGPLRFLKAIKEAEYVVTTSFHGVMFSVIFHKQFWYAEKPAAINKTAGRIYDFLKMLGLESRIVSDINNCDYTPIDYEKVDEKLLAYKEKSINFLRNSLG